MGQPRPLKTLVFRTTTFLCAVACLILAANRLRDQPDRLSLASTELTLTRSGTAPAALLQAAEASAERRRGDCLADFRRGAMAVALIQLRSTPDDPANHEKAHTTIVERLRCSPADGNAWLLLAEISAIQGETNDKTAALLQASKTYAPFEGWIVERRLAFACTAGRAAKATTAEVMRADFATLLAALEFRRAAKLYEICDTDAIRELDATLATSQHEVRAGFARAVAAGLPPR